MYFIICDLAYAKCVHNMIYAVVPQYQKLMSGKVVFFFSTIPKEKRAKRMHSWTCVRHNLLVASDTNFNHPEQISLLVRWHP